MIYRGIDRIYGDSNPLRKKVEDYGSVVFAYLSLRKAASLCRHPIVVAKQKIARAEEVELA